MEITTKNRKNAKKVVVRAAQWIGYKVGRSDALNLDRGLIQNEESLIFDIVFMNNLSSCGHFAINKKYYGILCQYAAESQACIMKYGKDERSNVSLESSSPCADEDNHTYWNKYRDICAQIITDPDLHESQLHCWFLAAGKAKYIYSPKIKLFDSSVTGLPEMRFCPSGDICTYRWSDEQENKTWGANTQLIEYRLSQAGVLRDRRCCLGVEIGFYLSLFFFKSRPSLLAAFLNSSVRHEGKTMKVYDLKDAYIPVDYSNKKKLSFKGALDGLPQPVQDAIVRRCAIQYKKLEKK